MNVILCGFHWTGCSALQQLLQAGHRVFVYTHEAPWHIPSLEAFCRETGTPYSLENITAKNLPFQPDLIASIYYRNIIKRGVIDACGGKIFNLHPSLLPVYRGCSSLTWAMVNGENQAGFTFHYIDEGCDTGRILVQQVVAIEPWDTQGTLYSRVQYEAMRHFSNVVERVVAGEPGAEQQGVPSYFKRGCPHDGQIDPAWDAPTVARFLRAMTNPPYPPAKLGEQEIRTLADWEAARSNLSPQQRDAA
jgi:methionyl-tRNA formyltransferase